MTDRFDPEKLAVVDAHHHLWNLDENYHPWLSDAVRPRRFGDYSSIRRNYGFEDFSRDTGGIKIEGSVLLEASAQGEPDREIRWLQSQADQGSAGAAVVGHAQLEEDPEASIARHLKASAFRGLRFSAQWLDDPRVDGTDRPHLLLCEQARAYAAAMSRHDIVLDVALFYPQADELIDLAQRNPDLTIVVNHCGMPLHLDAVVRGDRQKHLQGWQSAIRVLSRQDNIHIKLSGLWMAGRRLFLADIAPILDICVKAFGPRRSMFGSNFPVDSLWVSYREMIDITIEALPGLPVSDLQQIFNGTAKRVYRLT